MGTTNVPRPTLDATGVNAPSSAALYAGVMADFTDAFGTASMSTDPETPQGQLGTSFSAVLQAFIDLHLSFVSRVDPPTSSGRMQDAIGRFFGMTRVQASPTTTVAACVGAAGTVIPAGALAKTAGGDIFAAVGGGVIPAGGNLSLEFQSVESGALPCPAGYLNQVYQAVAGWDTITNPSDGTPGTDQESPQAFEVRRQAELSKNAQGFNASMRALLLDVPGVVDAIVYDNNHTGPITVRGVTIPAGAQYVCVYGGADALVAKAIFLKRTPGVPFYAVSPVTVTVADDVSGYALPLPTYSITFDRPAVLSFKVKVELSIEELVPDDVVAQVRAAVLQVFAGTDSTGKGRPPQGSRLLASRFYAPISALGPWADVVNIKLSVDGSTPSLDFVDLHFNQVAGSSSANITVDLV